ncbi:MULTISPECIES: hypothetical protein [unclassified Agarivorans]|uniref:hypothetical protein n=1 Tax=unclassified Agarivorans TaxID=2636026 RepID=UPI0010D2EFBB|nr:MULTISPECIES: hypothetical protein [unclassified Agarivorans]MDO6685593.1 hypothetical protein [Agarivorans sp. 3_MG-2023]MDO6715979.1 hypothetical protein [Agarivorans sp. 2_MG-2023]MDO6765930.1 hypothetical protein [Agarivorans sp. 1_MG-2023]GDY25404.1 hypothetical protein AHAT_12940 [Agarivorans sp. Toyoura001]
MLSPRIVAVALLSGLLLACSVEDEQPRSQIAVTFYPPAVSFPGSAGDTETITQIRHFRADGSSPSQSITINQRRDGEQPRINGEDASQNATFLIDFMSSTTLDVYSEGGEFLYNVDIFSDMTQKHLCLPSIHLSKFEILVDSPVKIAETKKEAHEFILACRTANEGIEEKAE